MLPSTSSLVIATETEASNHCKEHSTAEQGRPDDDVQADIVFVLRRWRRGRGGK
jgi:hypothetical protein